MPRGDGTGPAGMGRLTGRKAGFCSGFNAPGFMNAGFGRMMPFGRNRRFKRTSWFVTGLLPGCGYLAYRWINRNKTQK
ncbi:MAG: DUF5320 domain-containing protein [Bacteroidales bacterium]|jgi:hypothetical protein|nr:DUF5320 domain-containing protein [Bacteroidales bacterium]